MEDGLNESKEEGRGEGMKQERKVRFGNKGI